MVSVDLLLELQPVALTIHPVIVFSCSYNGYPKIGGSDISSAERYRVSMDLLLELELVA